ncbi:MAG: hypothetical protein IPM27_06250 [Nitrosomonadales bacterium]|nr:hypothetical protein [Nitrosomonadales bacterium]
MELVITSEDFRRLSPATQKELLAVLMGGDGDGDAMLGLDDYDSMPASGSQVGSASTGKRVFPINPAQATELLSNLAEKSQQTLRLFAVGERVAVDDLVGEDRPYKDMNDLKRSFVGAVNRRLRTVVGNRSAVLFSSDRDRQKIRVLPTAASALRQAMGIPEPEGIDSYDGADFDGALDEEQEV